MKVIELKSNPIVNEYVVFDDYMEAHKYIANKNDFTFHYNPIEYWRNRTINGIEYYQKSYCGLDNVLLTIEAYNNMIRECEKTFSIQENDLVRTQKNSNCSFTGDLKTKEEVIEYMLNKDKSWLPTIFAEIDEEVKQYKDKIAKLIIQKEALQDENYLRGKIETSIIVRSEKEKPE